VHMQYTETAKDAGKEAGGKDTADPMVFPVMSAEGSAPTDASTEAPTEAPTAAPAIAPTKLGINVEGGFQSGVERFDVTRQHSLAVWTGSVFEEIALPNTELPEFVSSVCEGIIQHNGMRLRAQAESWDGDKDRFESKYAASLVQLDNGKKISNDPKTWRCEMSGATDNLWLNLSTGFIGGGRKQWDGSGGSGGALEHFNETGKQYPLCVKLGTITPNGADIWSYAEDEDTLVLDTNLAAHLRHWGIDIMGLEKTEKSLIEMEAELNASYDWTKILEGGAEAETLSGPGLLGLKNIGSSCYMNSVLQALFNIPEVRAKYSDAFASLVDSSPADSSADLPVQLGKIGQALFTGRYCPPPAAVSSAAAVSAAGAAAATASTLDLEMQRYVVAPYMFKYLVGKNHREFSSGRQQDASEYFLYLLEAIERSERSNAARLAASGVPTNELFQFEFEKRLQCEETGQVKYISGRETLANTLELQIPIDLARPKAALEEKESKRQRVEGTY
jgi:ubiquitin carboxyl-terminal hydrolase 5/13